MNALELTQKFIRSCLQLSATEPLDRDTALLGGFPEFNSLTITTLIVEIEEALDCEIADDEISGEIFETVGSLADFVAGKMAQA
ncbi:MAG: phosphopantetheine-binding protein [Porticoccaceae bacterium]